MIMISGGWRYFGYRFIHTGVSLQAVEKGLLSKLRRKTGFSIIKCKNALEQFENDLPKAEAWLKEQAQKEGWAKASKLQGRTMSQGLIGMVLDKESAAMVELNCETDFVARNEKFQKLVSVSAMSCLNQGKASDQSKIFFDKEQVNALPGEQGRNLSDLVVMEVGSIGENMQLRRGVYCRATENMHLGSYIHTAGTQGIKDKCLLGKYGSLVIFQQSGEASCSTEELGRQLSQHIVGMNPRKVGTPDDEPKEDKDTETAMIHQEFLLDPDLTVKEFLDENGISVIDFVRFECGEDPPEEAAEEKQSDAEEEKKDA